MLEEEEWAEGVYLEAVQGGLGVDLRGCFLDVEHTWYCQCETERCVGVDIMEARCHGGDGGFIYTVLAGFD